jgi:hypothetical protein
MRFKISRPPPRSRKDTSEGHHADSAWFFPSTLVIPVSEPFAAHFVVISQGSMKDQGHGGQPCIQMRDKFQLGCAFERGTYFMGCQWCESLAESTK